MNVAALTSPSPAPSVRSQSSGPPQPPTNGVRKEAENDAAMLLLGLVGDKPSDSLAVPELPQRSFSVSPQPAHRSSSFGSEMTDERSRFLSSARMQEPIRPSSAGILNPAPEPSTAHVPNGNAAHSYGRASSLDRPVSVPTPPSRGNRISNLLNDTSEVAAPSINGSYSSSSLFVTPSAGPKLGSFASQHSLLLNPGYVSHAPSRPPGQGPQMGTFKTPALPQQQQQPAQQQQQQPVRPSGSHLLYHQPTNNAFPSVGSALPSPPTLPSQAQQQLLQQQVERQQQLAQQQHAAMQRYVQAQAAGPAQPPPGPASPVVPAQRKRKRTHSTTSATQAARLSPKMTLTATPTIPPSPSKDSAKARPDLPHFMGYDNQLYRCICGTTIEPEEGSSMQCESCLAWQHAGCFGLTELDLEGIEYFCELCSGRPYRRNEPYIDYCREYEKRLVALQDSEAPEAAAVVQAATKKKSSAGRKAKPRADSTSGKVEAEAAPEVPIVENEAVEAGPPKPARKKSSSARSSKTKPSPAAQRGPTPERATREPSAAAAAAAAVAPVTASRQDASTPLRLFEYTRMNRLVYRGKQVKAEMRRFLEEWADPDQSKMAGSEPDFDLLGPFVPPIVRDGQDWASSAAPTYVKLAEDGYQLPTIGSLVLGDETSTASAEHRQDPVYAVHASIGLSPGDFIGPFYGEVFKAHDYQSDPANQYAELGLPKANVRRVGPPINVIIDARCYGNDMRFIRSGCSPNAVIRPTLLHKGDDVELAFGVYACADIEAGSEISLAWEWDDQHVVHAFKDAIRGANAISLQRRVAVVATHLLNNFDTCACSDLSECAVARIVRFGFGERAIPELADKGGKKLRKLLIDNRSPMGPLVGVKRNWRFGESQAFKAEAAQTDLMHMLWQMFKPMVEPYLVKDVLDDVVVSQDVESDNVLVDEIFPSPTAAADSPVPVPPNKASEPAEEQADPVEGMEVDEQTVDAADVNLEPAASASPAAPVGSPTSFPIAVPPLVTEASPPSAPVALPISESVKEHTTDERAIEAVQESPIVKVEPSAPVSPRVRESSVLSDPDTLSSHASQAPDEEMEQDSENDDNLSETSTLTEPLSHMSESEADEDAEHNDSLEEESPATPQYPAPLQTPPGQRASAFRRNRRVLSPTSPDLSEDRVLTPLEDDFATPTSDRKDDRKLASESEPIFPPEKEESKANAVVDAGAQSPALVTDRTTERGAERETAAGLKAPAETSTVDHPSPAIEQTRPAEPEVPAVPPRSPTPPPPEPAPPPKKRRIDLKQFMTGGAKLVTDLPTPTDLPTTSSMSASATPLLERNNVLESNAAEPSAVEGSPQKQVVAEAQSATSTLASVSATSTSEVPWWKQSKPANSLLGGLSGLKGSALAEALTPNSPAREPGEISRDLPDATSAIEPLDGRADTSTGDQSMSTEPAVERQPTTSPAVIKKPLEPWDSLPPALDRKDPPPHVSPEYRRSSRSPSPGHRGSPTSPDRLPLNGQRPSWASREEGSASYRDWSGRDRDDRGDWPRGPRTDFRGGIARVPSSGTPSRIPPSAPRGGPFTPRGGWGVRGGRGGEPYRGRGGSPFAARARGSPFPRGR